MAKSINLLNKVLSVGFLYQFLRSRLNEYVAQETPRRRVPCGTNQHQKSWMKREHFPMMIIWELFLNYLHRRPLSSSASGRLCSSARRRDWESCGYGWYSLASWLWCFHMPVIDMRPNGKNVLASLVKNFHPPTTTIIVVVLLRHCFYLLQLRSGWRGMRYCASGEKRKAQEDRDREAAAEEWNTVNYDCKSERNHKLKISFPIL